MHISMIFRNQLRIIRHCVKDMFIWTNSDVNVYAMEKRFTTFLIKIYPFSTALHICKAFKKTNSIKKPI